MLYGVEIWGCTRSVETIYQVQPRAFRMFLGGHPTPEDITDDGNGIVTMQ